MPNIVLIGPTYAGKTSLMIKFCCFLSEIEETLRADGVYSSIIMAKFPNAQFIRARDVCLKAQPFETDRNDVLKLNPYLGEVEWIATSGYPDAGIMKEDFYRAIESNPARLVFVYDINLDALSNQKVMKALLNLLDASSMKPLFRRILKGVPKLLVLNKVDLAFERGMTESDMLKRAEEIINSVGEFLSDYFELRENPFEDAKVYFTYAGREYKPQVKKFELSIFNLFYDTSKEFLTEIGKKYFDDFSSKIERERIK